MSWALTTTGLCKLAMASSLSRLSWLSTIGLYFAIETKAPGKEPTVIQEATIKRIRAAGGLVFVVDTTEKARGLFTDRL